MKKYFAVFVFLLFSCSNDSLKTPDHVIRRDTLVNMLIDIQIIEAGISMNQIMPDSILPVVKSYYAELFHKYNTSPKRFNQSVAWYTKNAKLFEKMLEEALNRLMQNQSLEQHKLDSMTKKRADIKNNSPDDE